jgi:hypothetical protein
MMTGPLDDDEQRVFFELLRRVCEHHVDNFLTLRVDAEPLTFYVDIGLEPQSGDPELYVPIGPEARFGKAPDHSKQPHS